MESTLSVEPAAERAPFHGRIWVLVGPAVYSASESFAVFGQETGFATLVGSPTGGDGIGALDPVFLQLPNSGILVPVSYTHLFFPTYVRQYTLRSAALALWHHLLLDRGQHDGFILYLSSLPVSPPKSSLFASGRYVGKAVRRLWGLRTA